MRLGQELPQTLYTYRTRYEFSDYMFKSLEQAKQVYEEEVKERMFYDKCSLEESRKLFGKVTYYEVKELT